MINLSSYIFLRHSYEFSNFFDSVENYNFIIDDKEKVITYCRMTLLVLKHNLDEKQWREFCINLQDIVKEKYTDEDIKKLEEYKTLRTYINKFYEYKDITIVKRESPDFEIYLPNGKKIGVEVTKLINGMGAVINKISQNYFGRGKTAEEISTFAQKKYPKISKDIKIDNLSNGKDVAYISPRYTKDVTKEHLEYSKQILKKYLMFEEWNKKELFDSRIILCPAYSPITITNRADFEEISDELFKHKYLMPCQAVIYSVFDEFKGCWSIINFQNKEMVFNEGS